MCVSVLVVTGFALVMGYNPGEAAGLLAGSQTISAVIGVAEDTMANMGLDEAQRQKLYQYHPRILCSDLRFRYSRFSLGTLLPRSKTIGRTGESKKLPAKNWKPKWVVPRQTNGLHARRTPRNLPRLQDRKTNGSSKAVG